MGSQLGYESKELDNSVDVTEPAETQTQDDVVSSKEDKTSKEQTKDIQSVSNRPKDKECRK